MAIIHILILGMISAIIGLSDVRIDNKTVRKRTISQTMIKHVMGLMIMEASHVIQTLTTTILPCHYTDEQCNGGSTVTVTV